MAIDLTSGVPLDDSGIIEQIPLGGQVFPFADWDATARPRREPIYGDDILPTSALVAGQLPDRTAPQSVHTDGKHALLVKDVNGGGGGGVGIGSLFEVAIPCLDFGNKSVSTTDPTSIVPISGSPIVYAVKGEFVIWTVGLISSFDNPIVASVTLYSWDMTTQLLVIDQHLLGPYQSNPKGISYRTDMSFPGGLDMTKQLDASLQYKLALLVDGGDATYWGAYTVYTGTNPP